MDYVLGFHEVDRTQVAVVGGKGAQLGELSRIDGIRVPDGFCVTTDAFRGFLALVPSIDARLDRLSGVKPSDRETIRVMSGEIRRAIEGTAIPDDLAAAITRPVTRLGERSAYAVRSSATAEDLPGASFAGQQDSYLNIVGMAVILEHVILCWASLFTERAVTYRFRSGFDHRKVQMAVVVQRMVFPQAAGVLFTADPVTSSRRVASVEASFGLGEGLVSGLVNADTFTVRDGEVVSKAVATKQRAIHASPVSGTQQRAIAPERQQQPALTDAQVVRVVQLGGRIEAHFGHPQDIEWCLADGDFWIVQSRPITTLFPIPEAADDVPHVYISVGHQQMMTDAMKPLGLSMWQHTTPRPMAEAGGRLFVDVARLLASPTSRAALIAGFGKSDPLIGDALQTVADRGFVAPLPDDGSALPPGLAPSAPLDADPQLVQELIAQTQRSIGAMTRAIVTKTGPALLDFILDDLEQGKRDLFKPRGLRVIMVGMDAAGWLNKHLEEWLGERNAADVLTQSVPHNVTSEMGLALMDVADVVRPHKDLVAFLEQVEADGLDDDLFLDALTALPGGAAARDALERFLERYGMRCVGEIDVTRARWTERPTTLIPTILTNVRTFAHGEAERRFEQGRQQALAKRDEVLKRLRTLPDGERKAEETAQMIDRVRTFAGYREHPKYRMVCRYFIYKQVLLAEADRLVGAGAIDDREDVFFLRLEELADVVRGTPVDPELLRERKDAFREHKTLTPPRVMTSDGEVITGTYHRDNLPDGALAGLAVSAGTVEGRARVVLDIAQADLEPGDIVVTAYTDPSWTPLFLAIRGLVTEVGGLMTHGAVIAREYGLPAVVGVEQATSLIRDGEWIRLHGTEGYVEILSEPGADTSPRHL